MERAHKLVIIFAVLLTAFLPLKSASANSAPPPSEYWFTFDLKDGTTQTIESFTLVFCGDQSCTYSVEVTQTPNSVNMKHDNELYCYDHWCKWRMYTPIESGVRIDLPGFQGYPEKMPFRIKIRFPDGERSSDVFDGVPVQYGDRAYFKISSNAQTLTITVDDHFKTPLVSGTFRSFLLTLIVEPFVFAVLMWLWKRGNFRTFLSYVLLSLLANGISYPMLWGFFPAITAYHYESAEAVGLISLFGGLAFSILLAVSAHKEGKQRIGLRALAILLLPFLCVLLFFAVFRYGVYPEPISPTGISATSTIMLIEILAVVFESTFIYFMVRKKPSLSWLFLFCIITNAVSYFLGRAIL